MTVAPSRDNQDKAAGMPSISADSARWEQLRLRIEAETGMDFSGKRLERLQAAVRKVFSKNAAVSDDGDLPAQWDREAGFLERLAAELTVGESFFFRNEHHFRVLREAVIPEIARENLEKHEIRVWSAGCATGEEPYSLAILLDQVLHCDLSWRISVLGTDLNQDFLKRAAEASYRAWSFRQTNIHADAAYFSPQNDAYRLVPRIREHVRFAYLNLVKDVYPSSLTGTLGFDLILFRNVAIYLQPEVTKEIIRRFYRALRPGGWLLLGETEVSVAPVGEFEVRRFDRAVFYQKRRDLPVTTGDDLAQCSTPPALAAFAVARGVKPLAPLALPDWVPLPKAKTAAHNANADAAYAAVVAPLASSGNAVVTWESIESLIRSRRFDDVDRALMRVDDVNERAMLRLRCSRALLACADTVAARRSLDLCLRDSPLLIEAQLLKASMAEESGDLATAEQACRRAAYIDPRAAIAHFHLALILERRGECLKAAKSLATTLKLIENQDPHALAPYGEGVCNGRLREMVVLLSNSSRELSPFTY